MPAGSNTRPRRQAKGAQSSRNRTGGRKRRETHRRGRRGDKRRPHEHNVGSNNRNCLSTQRTGAVRQQAQGVEHKRDAQLTDTSSIKGVNMHGCSEQGAAGSSGREKLEQVRPQMIGIGAAGRGTGTGEKKVLDAAPASFDIGAGRVKGKRRAATGVAAAQIGRVQGIPVHSSWARQIRRANTQKRIHQWGGVAQEGRQDSRNGEGRWHRVERTSKRGGARAEGASPRGARLRSRGGGNLKGGTTVSSDFSAH